MNERRLDVRKKSFMQGRVYYNHRNSTADCIVRDFTTHGARLQFSDLTTLPDAFEVFIPSKDEHFQAHAIWHNGNDVGIAWSPESEGAKNLAPSSNQSGDSIRDRLAKLEHEVAILRKRVDLDQE